MDELNEYIDRLRKRDPKLTVTLDSEQTSITIIRGKLSLPTNITKLRKTPYEYARQFIRDNTILFGKIKEDKDLIDGRVIKSRRGITHIIFYQRYGNAEVVGGTLSVHYDAEGRIYLIKSNLVSKIKVQKRPRVSANRAIAIAKKHAGVGSILYKKKKPSLILIDAKTLHLEENLQKHYLCWRMRIVPPKSSRFPDSIYIVDAHKGKVLLRYSALQYIGTGYYSHGSDLNSEAFGGTFRLRDTVTSSTWPETILPIIHTYDDANSGTLGLRNYSEDPDNNWDNGGIAPGNRFDDQRPEVDIHRFLSYVLSYFYLTHQHNSWDGAGGDARGHVHNGYWFGLIMPNNAFWDPGSRELYFGDGDGTNFDFVTALDITGHEFTHGVLTGFNILQTYDGETGAANEALADLFGAFIALNHSLDDPWPWQMGRQIYLGGGIGRNMADPSRDTAGVVQYDSTSDATKAASCRNGYYPDHYSIRYTGSSDHHGVHWNCPIITHAVYLMINGGTHRLSNVTVNGIGVSPVEQIIYEVISSGLLTNTSDFADFRIACIESCLALYPDNLDYLATVKTAFHAVGIGPDLYIRDKLTDQGEEPGTLSCMSPDIILRQQQADAATLLLIGDINNASLCQNIELGPSDHFIYFRIFNRGSVSTSGTFRLFISPVSTFPTPSTWHEVGHYNFPNVPPGGLWVPTAANECIILPTTLINTLGLGHYCFIGIIESNADPAPDRMLIDNTSEFHDFISKSNNYAWRNCNIEDLQTNTFGVVQTRTHNFQINKFDRRERPRDLEIDTRDIPKGTKIILWIPTNKLWGLKIFETRLKPEKIHINKIAGVIEENPVEQILRRIPITEIMKIDDIKDIQLRKILRRKSKTLQLFSLEPRKIVRLEGLTLGKDKKMNIRFLIKFPKNVGPRDVTLVFRERQNDVKLGQINYMYRIR